MADLDCYNIIHAYEFRQQHDVFITLDAEGASIANPCLDRFCPNRGLSIPAEQSSDRCCPTFVVQPPIPAAPIRPPTPKGSLLNKPETFDGTKNRFKSWWRETCAYIRDPRNALLTDNERIEVVMSYIRGTKIEDWKQNYHENKYDDSTGEWLLGWNDFVTDLIEFFVDANEQRLAQERITSLRQGTGTASDYFNNLEVLITRAGYSTTDAHIVNVVEKGCNQGVIDAIYRSGSCPQTYKSLKQRIVEVDNLWRRREESK